MSRYGNDWYGLAYYGSDNLVDFDATPFTATPVGYGKLLLEWSAPTGNWDYLRLIRNPFGFPMTHTDGDQLAYVSVSAGLIEYLDEGQIPNASGLLPGHTYYYSLFVRETTNDTWVKAGDALGVSVKDYGTAEQMYDYLPAIYKINNLYSASDNSDSVNTDLYNFLRVFALSHDYLKTHAQNISERYDVLNLDGRLVPLLLNQFGLKFEPEIGIQQARVLLRNAIKVYSEKGSLSGLKTFVTAFTGYNCEINPPVNLMLSTNDASFRESIGFWESHSNATLSRGTAVSETPPVFPYFEVDSPSNFPNAQTGFLKAAATAAGDVEFVCGASAPLTRGIPVTGGLDYALTVYSRAKTTLRTYAVDILWYDRNGVLISSAGESLYSNTTTGWTRSLASSGTAPSTAHFAVPYIRVEGCALGEIHYFDAVQFEQSTAETTFADARRVDVVLKANRVNMVTNPSFEVDLSTWAVHVHGAADLERVAVGSLPMSSYSMRATKTSNDLTAIAVDYLIPVKGGQQYTTTVYGKSESPLTTFSAAVEWYNEAMEEIYEGFGTPQNLTSNWAPSASSMTAPANAAYARPAIVFTGATGSVAEFDCVMFEQLAFSAAYFDGSGGAAPLGDLIWEGGLAHASRSHNYKNREIVVVRLIDVLEDYIPLGLPWAVFLAQPD